MATAGVRQVPYDMARELRTFQTSMTQILKLLPLHLLSKRLGLRLASFDLVQMEVNKEALVELAMRRHHGLMAMIEVAQATKLPILAIVEALVKELAP